MRIKPESRKGKERQWYLVVEAAAILGRLPVDVVVLVVPPVDKHPGAG